MVGDEADADVVVEDDDVDVDDDDDGDEEDDGDSDAAAGDDDGDVELDSFGGSGDNEELAEGMMIMAGCTQCHEDWSHPTLRVHSLPNLKGPEPNTWILGFRV